ncbi:M48 family metallopeptidase [Alteromonadaceae bacterium BrNp21-10]|nr:M48 family metallopeptidase [Alteromonadaceae bacterium BrNp21-10]
MTMTLKTSLLIILITVLSACAKSPTGRNQLKLFPSNKMDTMGIQAFDGMKNTQKIAEQVTPNNFVQCVAERIIAQVPKSVFSGEWEVVVFDDEQVNAFALPGGKIGVYTGLLNVAENQHQLAAVIGHEVGHVIAEHGNERMSNSTLIGLGMEVTNQVLATNQVANNQQIMAALGFGVQVGLELPFSRTHESEADQIGLDLMAQAGFNPQQAVNLWENMDAAAAGQERPAEFMSTHPSPQTRIKKLQDHMPKALALLKKSTTQANCQ